MRVDKPSSGTGWIATGAIIGVLLLGSMTWLIWYRARANRRREDRAAAAEFGQEVVDAWDPRDEDFKYDPHDKTEYTPSKVPVSSFTRKGQRDAANEADKVALEEEDKADKVARGEEEEEGIDMGKMRAALVVIIVSIVTAIALAFSIWYLLNRRKANKAREANPNNCKPDTEKSPNGLSYTHSADVNNAPSVQYNLLEHADYQPRPESYQPQPPPLSYQPNVIQGYNQAGSPRSFEAPAPGSGYNAGYGQN
ncbi:hypothetical protein CspHIS471_0206440 [Cutaneotrichosporon sp. HIS471]|nr:hypothetical protein CspHIS471_0206440 [Cutaneotrichosporon sp. HIS471]